MTAAPAPLIFWLIYGATLRSCGPGWIFLLWPLFLPGASPGACVQVFDKSGDLGGRLALRRRSEERWNHGAPCVEAASEAFHNLLESLCEAGSATLTGEPSSALTRYSGAPDLRAAVNLGMGSAGGTRCFGLAEGWFVEPDAQGAFASAQTLVETMTGSWMSADVAASAQ